MQEIGYQQIATDLEAEIRRGDYPPNGTLPTERALADQYGVHVGTVRNAIRQLAAQGLIFTDRMRGTKVRDTNPVRLVVTRYTETTPESGPWETACAAQGLAGVTDVLGVSWQPAGVALARDLAIPEREWVVRRDNRMRTVGGDRDRVLQLQTTWLPEWVARDTPLALPAKVSGGIYRGLDAAGCAPVSAVETVTSRMPTREEVLAFGLRLGSPVLDARRVSRDREGRPVVRTDVVTDGDHVCFVYPQVI